MLPWYYHPGEKFHRGKTDAVKNRVITNQKPWLLPWFYHGKTEHGFLPHRFYRGNTAITAVLPWLPSRFYRGKTSL